MEVSIKAFFNKNENRKKETEKIQQFLDRYLVTVQKPGRYTGGEFNQITKNWENVDLRIALAFPDIYDIGFSNLGLSILYDLINSRSDALAERVFAPWIDMEELIRNHMIQLYALESKTPLKSFDLIGFSLPYETLYTNTLNMLDMANIPIISSKRSEDDPIIIAGGHACFNPEPMYAFIDAFVIGEAEEVIHEIVDCLKKGNKKSSSRKDKLLALSDINGIYVPAFFKVNYKSDHSINLIINEREPDNSVIKKRTIKYLPHPPTKFLVPNVSVVHNRVAVEIMRGCSRGCRFCQAGIITRPVRERTVDEIVKAISQSVQETGYEEVSLLSLSTSDYSKIRELLGRVVEVSETLNFNLSLPSMRIETFEEELIRTMSDKRKGNFTFAPESASESIRNTINKPISDQELLKTVENIFQMGWKNIKLYFMIGFPDECPDDVEKIVDICLSVKRISKKILSKPAKIHISINTLIPKPHTAFQWVSLDNQQAIEEKYYILIHGLKKTGIKIDWSDYHSSLFEAWLSRGDRRLSKVIKSAWEMGAKFDAWHEIFDIELWKKAFQESEIDPYFYSHRERYIGEIFPWDHIDTGVRKNFLIREYEKSQQHILTSDCRDKCHACGIQISYDLECDEFRKKV